MPKKPQKDIPKNKFALFFRMIGEHYQSILMSAFVGTVGFVATIFLLSHTDIEDVINSWLQNGWGPYQVSAIILVIIAVAYNFRRGGRIIRRAFFEGHFTIVDKTWLAVAVWGIEIGGLAFGFPAEWTYGNAILAAIMLIWVIGLLWIISRCVLILTRLTKSNEKPIKPRLLSDHPIGKQPDDEDILGRSNVVEQIVSVITEYDTEGAFVVAVTGEWGSGKTTALNLALSKVKSRKDVIPVIFDPWNFTLGTSQNLDILLSKFFEAIASAISSHVFNPSLIRTIDRYYKAIAPIFKTMPFDLEYLLSKSKPSLETTRDELNFALSQIGAKIVIIIDDLDRMSGTEIAYVFKIVRLCGNFDNVIYIIAFDQTYVYAQLEKEFGARARDYIRKIIQLDLRLPMVEPAIVNEIFIRNIRLTEKYLDIKLLDDPLFANRFRGAFDQYISFLLNNIRLIKSFINQYLLTARPIRGEVNYFDLMVLEVIRLRNPDFYNQIPLNAKFFTYRNEINWTVNSKEVQEITQFFKAAFKDGDAEHEAILGLLGTVFNSVSSYHHKSNVIYGAQHAAHYFNIKSAAHPYYFPRYFYLALQQGAISDVLIDNYIAEINASNDIETQRLIRESVETEINNHSIGQWLDRMRLSTQRVDSGRASAVILALVTKPYRLSVERPGFFSVDELMLFTFFVADLFRRVPNDEVADLFRKIINECADVEILRRLFGWFTPGQEGFALEQAGLSLLAERFEEMKRLVANRLRRTYIIDSRSIFQDRHHFDGLYALRAFLTPEENRPYISRLIQDNAQNAVEVLRALTSIGYSSTENQTRSFRILEYDVLKSLVDPLEIQQILDRVSPTLQLSDDEIWSLKALAEGIERETRGETVEKIQEDPWR